MTLCVGIEGTPRADSAMSFLTQSSQGTQTALVSLKLLFQKNVLSGEPLPKRDQLLSIELSARNVQRGKKDRGTCATKKQVSEQVVWATAPVQYFRCMKSIQSCSSHTRKKGFPSLRERIQPAQPLQSLTLKTFVMQAWERW